MPRSPPTGTRNSESPNNHRPSPYLQQRFASREADTDKFRHIRTPRSPQRSSSLVGKDASDDRHQSTSRQPSVSDKTELDDHYSYMPGTPYKGSSSSAGSESFKTVNSSFLPTARNRFYTNLNSGRTCESITDAFANIQTNVPRPNTELESQRAHIPGPRPPSTSKDEDRGGATRRDKGKAKEVNPPRDWFASSMLDPNALHLNLSRPKLNALFPHMPTIERYTHITTSGIPKRHPPQTEGPSGSGPRKTVHMGFTPDSIQSAYATSEPNPLHPPAQQSSTKSTPVFTSPISPLLPPSARITPEPNTPGLPTSKSHAEPMSKSKSPRLHPLPPSTGATPQASSPSLPSHPTSTRTPEDTPPRFPDQTPKKSGFGSPILPSLPPSTGTTPWSTPKSHARPMSKTKSPRFHPLPPSTGATPQASSPSLPSQPTSTRTPENNPPRSPEHQTPKKSGFGSPIFPSLPPSTGTTPWSTPESHARPMSKTKSPRLHPLPPSTRTTPEASSPSLPPQPTSARTNSPCLSEHQTPKKSGFDSPILPPLPPSTRTTPGSTPKSHDKRTAETSSPLPPSSTRLTPKISSPSLPPLQPDLTMPPEPGPRSSAHRTSTKLTPGKASPILPPLPLSSTTTPEPSPKSRTRQTPKSGSPTLPLSPSMRTTPDFASNPPSPPPSARPTSRPCSPLAFEMFPLSKPVQSGRLRDIRATSMSNVVNDTMSGGQAQYDSGTAMDVDDEGSLTDCNGKGKVEEMEIDDEGYHGDSDINTHAFGIRPLSRPLESDRLFDLRAKRKEQRHRSQENCSDILFQQARSYSHDSHQNPIDEGRYGEKPNSRVPEPKQSVQDDAGREVAEDDPRGYQDSNADANGRYGTFENNMFTENATPELSELNFSSHPSEGHDEGVHGMDGESSTKSATYEGVEEGWAYPNQREKKKYEPLTADHISDAFNVFGRVLGEQLEKGFEGLYSRLDLLTRGPRISPDADQRPKKKRGSFPNHRSFDTNHMAREVRIHLNTLLKESILQMPMVTPEQSNLYTVSWNVDGGQACAPSCTTDDFKIDLLGVPSCAWNQSASRVFCRSFLDFHGLPDDENIIDIVSKAFFTRVKTLKAQYGTELRQRHEQPGILAKQNRRYRRKYSLFQRRLTAATMCDGLKKHVDLLRDLTVDGMSSDESDDDSFEAGKPCHVSRPAWRADELGPWLRVFDSVYSASIRGRGAGQKPHLRIHNQLLPRISKNKKVVSQLPLNAYDTQWLARQNDIDFSVRPRDIYEFSHDNNLFSLLKGGG